MEETLDDLGLVSGAGEEQWDIKLQEKLGLKIIDLQGSVSQWVSNNSDKLAGEFINVAPGGDYSLLIEDAAGMSSYFKEEVSKPEHWKLSGVRIVNNMLEFMFDCPVVDDGETLKGFVFTSKTGKIKHSFAQYQD